MIHSVSSLLTTLRSSQSLSHLSLPSISHDKVNSYFHPLSLSSSCSLSLVPRASLTQTQGDSLICFKWRSSSLSIGLENRVKSNGRHSHYSAHWGQHWGRRDAQIWFCVNIHTKSIFCKYLNVREHTHSCKCVPTHNKLKVSGLHKTTVYCQ